jgi:hypothetical protein
MPSLSCRYILITTKCKKQPSSPLAINSKNIKINNWFLFFPWAFHPVFPDRIKIRNLESGKAEKKTISKSESTQDGAQTRRENVRAFTSSRVPLDLPFMTIGARAELHLMCCIDHSSFSDFFYSRRGTVT